MSMVRPDASPTLGPRGGVVRTPEDAMALTRGRAGSWTPTGPKNWASPVPTGQTPNRGGFNRQISDFDDFDLIIDSNPARHVYATSGKAPASSGFDRQISVQVDTDGSRRRKDVFDSDVRSKFEVEQLLQSPGTLPKPMTREEREATVRKLLPTATHELMAKIPHEIVSALGIEGQALRRKLANGATMVFFTAGYPGKRFIFERACELGIKSVIIEHPDSWSRSLVEEGIVAKFIPVDMAASSEDIFEETLKQLRQLGSDGLVGQPDAICTFVELSVPVVARLAEKLGLPGQLPSAVDSARDKHQTRAVLKANGLPTPKNCLIRSEAECASGGAHVGFPAVLKPISGAASLGVKKVDSQEDILRCYREVTAELGSLVVASGALVKNDGSGTGVAAGNVVDMTVLLEQYLDGPEVDIDVVVSEGKWRYAAVSDNGPTLEPYFNETWAVCPSLLSYEKQAALKDLAVKSVAALGFDSGVFHVECKYTSTGPQLIEVNARMGGGQVRECNQRTWGVDLVEETLFIALGIPSRPAVPKVPFTSVAYCYVNAMKSGKIKDLNFLDALFDDDDIIWAKPLCRAGDDVVGPAEGLPTWIADILVNKPLAQDALDFLLKVESELPVQIS